MTEIKDRNNPFAQRGTPIQWLLPKVNGNYTQIIHWTEPWGRSNFPSRSPRRGSSCDFLLDGY